MSEKPGQPAALATFTQLKDGTRDEYQRIKSVNAEYYSGVGDRILTYFDTALDGVVGLPVDAKTHSLQTASRALRSGATEEMVVAALLHDIGEPLGQENHGEVASALLRPYVSATTTWILQHHVIFQAYYYAHHFDGDRHARDRYRDHPNYESTIRFCEDWDQASFDPGYDTLPLETFAPLVRRIFSRAPWRPEQW